MGIAGDCWGRTFGAYWGALKVIQHSAFYHGTGSYPEPPHGWQRAMRLAASQPPLITPYLRIASMAYCEQVGVYRHAGGVRGEMHFW